MLSLPEYVPTWLSTNVKFPNASILNTVLSIENNESLLFVKNDTIVVDDDTSLLYIVLLVACNGAYTINAADIFMVKL